MKLFEIESEHFDGEVKVIRPASFPDKRGDFVLTYLEDEYKALGLPKFVRNMYTRSDKNVLRGLHFQFDRPMGKLMQVIHGAAYMVAVDISPFSPTFLQHHCVIADDHNKLQVWAPATFARGYYALSPNTIVYYNCDAYSGTHRSIYWNDSDIAIDWPLLDVYPIMSDVDASAKTAKEVIFGEQR
jgi:dTDP-4-dehydrorhamnose 3,5-epimerase